jgi:hypothetical protein
MAFTHDFSSVQALPFPNGTAVFDDAYPDARATVLTGGPEQSEVIYDGGFVRTRPNDCLHKVGEETAVAPAAETAPMTPTPVGAAVFDVADPERHETGVETIAGVLAEHARAIRELAARTVENIIAIGRHLTEVRDQYPGEWLAWLEAEFSWSDQTARRYMHVYDLSRDARLNTCVELDLPLRVLYRLAAPKAEHARQEIADRVKAGEEVTRETIEEAVTRIRQKSGLSPIGAVEPADDEKSASLSKRRKSGFDAEHYAFMIGVNVCGLNDLRDEHPERFDAVLDHILNDDDVGDALTELARHPKIGALVTAVIGDAGGGDIYDWIPTDRRDAVCRGFLDRLTVAGMRKVMSDEFGRQLRARLPKRNDDIGPYSPGEHDRLRARVEELSNEKHALAIKIGALESEVAHLKEQLDRAAEPPGHPDGDLDIRSFSDGSLWRGQS